QRAIPPSLHDALPISVKPPNGASSKPKSCGLKPSRAVRSIASAKLRYEAVPGMWIPALLYEPSVLTKKVPVALHVNGHDPTGKADRKSTRLNSSHQII